MQLGQKKFSVGLQKSPYQHLGLCILAFDLAHVVAAGGGGVGVGHFFLFLVLCSLFLAVVSALDEIHSSFCLIFSIIF
jgi:hypothetical protein